MSTNEDPSAQELLGAKLGDFVESLAREGFSREQVCFALVCVALTGLHETFGDAGGKRLLEWFMHGFNPTAPHPGLAGMETKGRA